MERERIILGSQAEVSPFSVEKLINSKNIPESSTIIDISGQNDRSIFDILVAEKKKEILHNYTETIVSKEKDDHIDREFMFGA
jgi:hypothetical protein